MESKNISISFIRLAVGVLLLLLVISFTGCIFFAGSDTGIAVPNLTIKGAPSDITALSLRITGPGMAPVESYYSSVPSSIEIEVPAGVDRQFELLAYPSSISAAVSFKGTATVDLAAGETTEIILTMDLNETKLVIPDRALTGGTRRLVQIDDIYGTGWEELLTIVGVPIRAHDTAFDSMGRIYIADNDGTDRRVVRIDNIAGDNPIYIQEASIGALVAVSVDRKNNLVYFSDGTDLARSNLDGTAATQLTITGIVTIRGMDIDKDGMLYIAGETGGFSPRIFRYNTTTNSVDATYGPGNLVAPWDILIKQEHLYVANVNGANGFKILKLDLDLNFQEGFGNNASGPYDTTPGNFYNPHRFIAISNKKIYLLESVNSSGIDGYKRIVSMDNIGPWDSWDTFYAEDIGETPFIFYNC